MGDFTLPSGRVVKTHEPTFGDQIKLGTLTLGAEDFIYAKFALIVPELLRPEIEALSPTEGQALLAEVNRLWQGRPDAESVPLSNGGQPSSMALNLEK